MDTKPDTILLHVGKDMDGLVSRTFIANASSFPQKKGADIVLPWSVRQIYIRLFGYAIPCLEAIQALQKYFSHQNVVDAGAGTGYWSSVMRHYVPGISIIPCDSRVGKFKDVFRKPTKELFGIPPVRVQKTDALRRITSNTDVFMSWPMYDSDFGYKVAKKVPVGRTLVLISEPRGGCCGNDKMFDCLSEHYQELEQVTLPTFDAIHDDMRVFQKISRVTGK